MESSIIKDGNELFAAGAEYANEQVIQRLPLEANNLDRFSITVGQFRQELQLAFMQGGLAVQQSITSLKIQQLDQAIENAEKELEADDESD